MANVVVVTPEMREEWSRWLAERPPRVREVAERLVPWKLYRLHNPNGVDQRVTVISYSEPEDPDKPVTVMVAVSGDFNRIAFSRRVFGIDPSRLTECDLPDDDELVGGPEISVDRAKMLFSMPEDERRAAGAQDSFQAHVDGHFRPFREVRMARGL